jgi:hypothetical protein
MSPADPKKAPAWWMLHIVAPVVAGVILLIAGGVVGGVFGRDDEHATTPSATPPPPVAPSSSPPPPVAPSSSLTVGEFAQRANEICVDTPRLGEFRKPIRGHIPRALGGDKHAEQELQRQIERFKKVLRKRQRRLQALGAPRGEARATAEEFVRADSSIQHGVLAALSDIQDALRQGNRGVLVNRVSRLKRADAANGPERAHRDALARELGAEQCA